MTHLNPINYCVVKYYELTKQVGGKSIPFVLAYMRSITDAYRDLGYKDRVDIDIQTAVNYVYVGAQPQTIVMDNDASFQRVKLLASGYHYNALIIFLAGNSNGNVLPKIGRIEILLSLYVESEEHRDKFSQELTEFALQGGGIYDFDIEEKAHPCDKLSFNRAICPIEIYSEIGNPRHVIITYQIGEPYGEAMVIDSTDTTLNIIYGNNDEGRTEISKLMISLFDRNIYYRGGILWRDVWAYEQLKAKLEACLANENTSIAQAFLTDLGRIMEI